MPTGDFGYADGQRIYAEFKRTGLLAKARARLAARHSATRMLQKVRAKASGRPGPNVETGAYLQSIGFTMDGMGGDIAVAMGSDAEQMYRLELGFTGVDSLGRHYNQPPFPHWRPAADESEWIWEEAIANSVMGSLGHG